MQFRCYPISWNEDGKLGCPKNGKEQSIAAVSDSQFRAGGMGAETAIGTAEGSPAADDRHRAARFNGFPALLMLLSVHDAAELSKRNLVDVYRVVSVRCSMVLPLQPKFVS